MSRISRQQMFMEIARVVSMRSTCQRKSVGAILVTNNRIVSIGYNGSPPGHAHCAGADCPMGADGGCIRAIHAEENAIEYLPKNLVMGPGLDMYVTCSPCVNCATGIVDTPINRLFFESTYRDKEGLDHIVNCGIKCYRVTPSGYVLQITREDPESPMREVPVTLDD